MSLALLDRTRLNKVPQVALLFWIPKILSTAVDETGADYLAVHVELGVLMTDGIMVLALAAALATRSRQGSRQQV